MARSRGQSTVKKLARLFEVALMNGGVAGEVLFELKMGRNSSYQFASFQPIRPNLCIEF